MTKYITEEIAKGFEATNIPSRMHYAIVLWIKTGRVPGGFLTAVLENNFNLAVVKADDENAKVLVDYVHFLHNYAPSGCWGSPANVKDWSQSGGVEGIEARKTKLLAGIPELTGIPKKEDKYDDPR